MKRINLNFVFTAIMTVILMSILYFIWSIKPSVWLGLGIFILSHPYRIKGAIWSIWGGFSRTNANVYSLIPIIQYSKGGTVIGFVSPLCIFQHAEQESILVAGVCLIQSAKSKTTGVVLGVIGFQIGPTCSILVGICALQIALKTNAEMLAGIIIVQVAEEDADMLLGASVFQIAKNAETRAGVCMCQSGNSRADLRGIVIFQECNRGPSTTYGFALAQMGTTTEATYSVFQTESELSAC